MVVSRHLHVQRRKDQVISSKRIREVEDVSLVNDCLVEEKVQLTMDLFATKGYRVIITRSVIVAKIHIVSSDELGRNGCVLLNLRL